MDVLEAIRMRRSIRKFQEQPVPEPLIRQLLEAAMMAPSACNAQPWQFVVIDDREMLDNYARLHSNAAMASRAPMAILVCGDLRLEISNDYWPVDCSAAVQNLLLAVHAVGLGAVWTGVYPRVPRMEYLQEACRLPNEIKPHSLIIIGYPAETPPTEDRYHEKRVFRNRFGE